MKKYLVEADRLFLDKFDISVEYKQGSTLIVDEERKDDLVKRGLAHVISETTVEEEKEPDVEEATVDEETTIEEKTESKSDKTKKSKIKE